MEGKLSLECHLLNTKFIICTGELGRVFKDPLSLDQYLVMPPSASSLKTDKNDANSRMLVRFDFRLSLCYVHTFLFHIFLIMTPWVIYTSVIFIYCHAA